MPSLIRRRIVGVLSSLMFAVGAATLVAAPAHAEDGYQYWMYFHLEDGAWAFSEVGPADYQPEDGAVEGFRYGVSTANAGIEPRADLDEVDFDTVCGNTEAADGQKRVAVVLDYGTVDEEAPDPRAACAVVDADASTQDVLGEVAQTRIEGGMTCAFDGYPATGCGEPVPNAEVPSDEEPVAFAMPAGADEDAEAAQGPAQGDDTFTALILVATIAVVLAMVALVIAQRRKRKA